MKIKPILIVDDDIVIVQLLQAALEREGYTILSAGNGTEALHIIRQEPLSLILLDIIMPDMNGLDICRKIRDHISVPILLLSAKDRELDKIVGLEFGADDYITKPFSVDEVVARVKSHLRREARSMAAETKPKPSVIEAGPFFLNKETYEAFKDGTRIELSTKEFQILACLAENTNRVLSREQIYEAVWGPDEFGDRSTITVHLKNIRSKLDPEHRHIMTIWGAGYKFVP